MAIFSPASLTWLRTSRRRRTTVSTCGSTGPGGIAYRSLATSARTMGEPIAAARSMWRRSVATTCG
jgi:hypothetical protein